MDQVYIHNIAAPDLLGDRLLAEVRDVRDLVRRGDGSLVWVGSDGVGHVLDPETGRDLTLAFPQLSPHASLSTLRQNEGVTTPAKPSA